MISAEKEFWRDPLSLETLVSSNFHTNVLSVRKSFADVYPAARLHITASHARPARHTDTRRAQVAVV